MSIYNRPYIGTWKANGRQVIQYTPDCLVYINGDTNIPGCTKCSGKIDLQQFITSVSVDAGTDPGGSSANFSLSIPKDFSQSLFRDNRFILSPGLEVHIYMKGYFSVAGLYQATEKTEALLEELPFDLSDLNTHPYYHVFHGVLTEVSFDYSGGFYHASASCGSLLHFWAYQMLSTDASYFGARPSNSPLKPSLVGHNYTGMTPYAIIYSLYRDVAGHAAGVGFNLSSRTNVNAVNPLNPDETLTSSALRYWEKRFKTRMNTLRMHGASGELFSAAQQAFLSRLGSAGAKKLVQTQYKDLSKQGLDPKDPFSVAKVLDLVRVVDGELVKPIDLILQGRAGSSNPNKEDFGINIAAIHAFVSDLSQWGNVNLFEGTYESKMDIASRVCEVTGFEFFQDVDGDYVFKPPFYNLDVSSNRVYRIEDIDLVSLSCSEKEPDVTYMIAKGQHFANLNVGGIDGEWGVGTRYYDFRAIAKYGWKQGSAEYAYLTDPYAIMVALVNKMDLMNLGVNSASVTIPLRPEMRAGYPVYIPSIDSYYYVSGINHSFQFGGSCSTSLTLTGKRSKFYAPGIPSQEGISSIRLDSISLPEKPLEVIGEGNLPRLSGFPNVVMALDPEHLNPLFWLVGQSVENLGTPQGRQLLLESLRALGEVAIDPLKVDARGLGSNDWKDTESYVLYLDDENTVTLKEKSTNVSRPLLDAKDFGGAAARYNQKVYGDNGKGGLNKKKIDIIKKIKAEEANILVAEKESNATKRDQKTQKIQKRMDQLKADLKGLSEDLDSLGTSDPAIQTLLDIIRVAKVGFLNKFGSDIPDVDSTAGLLDILADKKASMSNAQLPGFYRYYSSSHPNPDQQGQKRLIIDQKAGIQIAEGVEKLSSPQRGSGYIRSPQILEGGYRPEAELGEMDVLNGINVVLPGSSRNTQVLPTSEITTLMFAQHKLSYEGKQSVNINDSEFSIDTKKLASKITGRLIELFKNQSGNEDSIVGEVWGDYFNNLSEVFQFDFLIQFSHLSESFLESSIDNYEPIVSPLLYKGVEDLNAITFKDIEMVKSKNINKKIATIASILGDRASKSIGSVSKIIVNDLYSTYGALDISTQRDTQTFKENKNIAYLQFAVGFEKLSKAATGGSIDSIARFSPKKKLGKDKTETITSPIFPVSDAQGYNVVGTYRYGRGLSIETGGTFEEIMSQNDPLRWADVNDVDAFVRSLQNKQTLSLDQKVRLAVAAGLSTPISEQEAQNINTDFNNSNTDINSRVNLFENQFQNWVENTKFGGISKLSVTNAAFQLADLQVFSDKSACACRLAEADITFDALVGSDFLQIQNNENGVNVLYQQEMLPKIESWKQNQDNLKGKSSTASAPSLQDAFRGAKKQYSTIGNTADAGFENLDEIGKRAARQASTLGEDN